MAGGRGELHRAPKARRSEARRLRLEQFLDFLDCKHSLIDFE